MLPRVLLLLQLGFAVCHASVSIVGSVVSVSEAEQSLEVSVVRSGENAIPSGETITFGVNEGDHEIGYVGRGIRGNGVQNDGKWYLGQIFPASGPDVRVMRETNVAFRDLVDSMPRGKYLKVGDTIPDFSMFDQNGEVLSIRELRGNAVVMNFIFTRCGMPEMCPASSRRMERMQESARERGIDSLHFVTVSFDPAFDSPGVLRGYGEAYGIEFENFSLVTAAQEVIDDLLTVFGILTVEEDGTINHTMATLLIDSDGKIVNRQEGPDWDAEIFLESASRL